MKEAIVSRYDLPDQVTIERAAQRDGFVLWAVRQFGECLNAASEWEQEPSPSNRNEEFLARCRFATPELAYAAWAKTIGRAPEPKPEAPAPESADDQVEPPVSPAWYLVVAYRWGWTNNHWYLVGQCADHDRALELAEEECDSRGGKYGVAVYQWDSQESYQQVAYYHSAYKEDTPATNHRIDLFQHVGQRAYFAVADGEIMLPHPEQEEKEKTRTLHSHPVNVPWWLIKIVADQVKQSHFMTLLDEDLRARQKSGIEQTKKERDAWVADAIARSDAEANKLYQRHAPKVEQV